MAKIKFSENINTAFYADFRIFVYGVDVSEWAIGSLEWVLSDKMGDNTAKFTLQNAYDAFVMTSENLKGQYRLPQESLMYSERAKRDIVAKKDAFDPQVNDLPLYPLGLRNIVIHKHDPVRIFIQNPITSDVQDQWLNVFTGYVDEVSRSKDYLTGKSELQISCRDLRMLMQRMRVSIAPTYGKDEVKEVMNDPKGFFADAFTLGNYSHPFIDTSFELAMKGLILGQDKIKGRGIGKMARGEVYYYDPEKKTAGQIQSFDENAQASNIEIVTGSALLERWYSLLLFGNRAGIGTRPLTYAEVIRIGSKSHPDGDFAPDNQKFYMLLPTGGTQTHNLVEKVYSEGVETKDFGSRWDIIKSFCDTIDYNFWITGSGDMVFEFPMYEFTPEDFSSYRNVMTVDDHLVGDDISDEHGEIVTALTVNGGLVDNATFKDSVNPSTNQQPRILIANKGLAARLGIYNASKTMPTVVNKAALSILAQVEFFKRLSETSSMSMRFTFRPWLFPNKPALNVEEKRMGTTTSVTNRMTFFGECSTDISLNYIRKLNRKGQYAFLDGGKSVVASYREAWSGQLGNTLSTGYIEIDLTEGTKDKE